MERPSIDEVLRVLDTLYHNAENTSEKQQASSWLTKFHSSVFAWEIADQLLLLKRDMETSYFAAQTMQNKVRHSFDELPENVHKDLRDSLMNHLEQLCDAPALITRQLAMALADLALQMSGWNTFIPDLVTRFKQELSTVSVLLDVLIVLPEEMNNRSLHLGQNRRRELRDYFGSHCADILSLLAACLSSHPGNTEIMTRVYACMGSWVQLGNFPGEALATSSLMLAPFQTLKLLEVPQKLYESASDCICSTLYMCEDSPSYYSLAQMLQTEVQKLQPEFQAAVQSEDVSRATALCHIFTELAETFLFHMVHQSDVGLGRLHILDLLLDCVAHPDYDMADITFGVWYRLSEELLKQKDEELNTIFRFYIQRLIVKLCTHCQLDVDTKPTRVNSEDGDDFTHFRRNVVELVRDVVFIVGSLTCFADLYSTICQPGTPWNVTEACLFMMYAVAPAIRRDESEVLPIAIPVLVSISCSHNCHYAIRATTLRLVGELAEWIDQHPDILELVLRFILDGLRIPMVATYAAKAVQSVCLKCKQRMAPHIDLLLEVIQAADNLGISNDAVIGLLKGITEVLTKMAPDAMTSGIRSLCSLHTTILSQMNVSSYEAAGSKGSSTDPCVWLDRLSAIFRSSVMQLESGQCHPCVPIIEEIWPIVCASCYKFKNNQRIVERTCRCIRFMIRSVGKGASPIISPLATMCIDIYQSYQHSCFLYLGSVVVDEFGAEPAFQQGLMQFLQALVEVALKLLVVPGALVQNPDTVDDLFRLCSRYLQRCPLLFLAHPVAYPISQCALAAATLNHRDAFSSVMKYLRDLVHLPEHNTVSEQQVVVESFLNQNGEVLMDALVKGFISLPSDMIPDSTEVLFELSEVAKEPVWKLLQNSVDRVSTGKNEIITPQQKSEFFAGVSKCTSAEDLLPVIKDFARLYR